MAKFEVVFEEQWTRTFIVEAADEDEALDIAANEDPDKGVLAFVENLGTEIRPAD